MPANFLACLPMAENNANLNGNRYLPRLPDFAGRLVSLSDSPQYWQLLHATPRSNGQILLMGLGCGDIRRLPFIRKALELGDRIFWLEDESILAKLRQVNGFWQPPANDGLWLRILPEDTLDLARQGTTYFYRPGMRLAPDFWGQLLAKLDAGRHAPMPSDKAIWLPGGNQQLLHQELLLALHELGYSHIHEGVPPNFDMDALAQVWVGHVPELALSVNFCGLDADGHIFHLCASQHVPVVIWMVDNPWHLLSGIKFPWWRKAHIFVTDSSFIEPLRKQGARHVWHCPLAASPHMRQNVGGGGAPPLFVGRAAFPARESFFKGIKKNATLELEARELLNSGQLPDYHWWQERTQAIPWPGMACRQTGFHADYFSAINRAKWLNGLPEVRIVGDEAWDALLPNRVILPPVDYYGALPGLYNEADAVLNVTSLLLPGSLNQRHFDVWQAGGLLLGDSTPGMAIFPRELAQAATVTNPDEFRDRLSHYRKHPSARRELINAWRQHIQHKHLYTHRLEYIMGQLAESGGYA